MSHVAHILSSYGMGGQERVAFDLATGQLRAGWQVSVVSLAPPPDGPLAEEFRAAGINVARVERDHDGLDPKLVLRLARWFRDNKVDLVHTHNRMALTYGAPAGRLARAKVVHTKHGKNPRGGKRLILGNAAGRLVHAFVAVSDETAAVARKRYEVPHDLLSVIDNGIDLARFHPDEAARVRLRGELGIPADACVIGTVARIAPEKNHARLLRAAAPLLGPKTRLVIAGDGPLLDAIRAQAVELGIAQHAHLLGVRRDVPALLNAFDIFAMSSETEGLPLVVLEAMASNLPVVSTNVGGIPNVVDEGRTGYLVDVSDEAALTARLAALVQDAALRRTVGARARDVTLTKFSAERMQREYLELYARVLGRA
jgi:glycosyltransferase involved in cell wall biosynthesis